MIASVVVLAVVLSLGHAGPAAAAPRFKALDSVTGVSVDQPVITDGRRFAALQPSSGTTRVVDTQRGRSYVVPTPGEGCTITGGGAGQIVWTCPDPRGNVPVLLDAQTRQAGRPPGVDGLLAEVEALRARYDGGPVNVRFAAVGRRWLEGRAEFSYSGSKTFSLFLTVHLDRRTGARRYDSPSLARSYPDLDRPGLVRKLCRPVSRTPGDNPSGNAPAFESFAFENGFALDLPPGERRLLLERCGRRPVAVSRCRTASGCYSEQLGGGVLTWAERRAAFAYGLSSGRRHKLAPAAARAKVRTGGCGPLAVVHTRTRIFVSVASGPPDAQTRCSWRVYVARLPRS